MIILWLLVVMLAGFILPVLVYMLMLEIHAWRFGWKSAEEWDRSMPKLRDGKTNIVHLASFICMGAFTSVAIVWIGLSG